MTRDRALCHRCAALRRGDHASQYTPGEWIALCKTGLAGERDGEPIVKALWLRRQGIVQFAGMPRPALCEWETPAFRCPWSPLELPPVLRHGPAYRSADGQHSDTMQLDEHGCLHRQSHCPAYRGGYFVQPFDDPALPRRTIPLW
jgi:hypothetical protein